MQDKITDAKKAKKEENGAAVPEDEEDVDGEEDEDLDEEDEEVYPYGEEEVENEGKLHNLKSMFYDL